MLMQGRQFYGTLSCVKVNANLLNNVSNLKHFHDDRLRNNEQLHMTQNGSAIIIIVSLLKRKILLYILYILMHVYCSFDPDPTKRMNFYGVTLGNALTFLGVYGYSQTGLQRYASLPTLGQARR